MPRALCGARREAARQQHERELARRAACHSISCRSPERPYTIWIWSGLPATLRCSQARQARASSWRSGLCNGPGRGGAPIATLIEDNGAMPRCRWPLHFIVFVPAFTALGFRNGLDDRASQEVVSGAMASWSPRCRAAPMTSVLIFLRFGWKIVFGVARGRLS